MQKTLYIAEFSRDDSDNESIWFVGLSNLTYEEQEELAYQNIKSDIYDDDCTIEELKEDVTVEGVYTIPQELIAEVYESNK